MSDPPDVRPVLRLLPGQDRRIRSGHPWAYSNELVIDAEARRIPPGSLVRLVDAAGRPVGTATFNVHSLIAARLLDADPELVVDADFFGVRLAAALALRERVLPEPYYRLVHAEADRLPGIVIDRFRAVLVVQLNTAGAERLKPELLAGLERVLAPEAIVLRNDSPVRALEGLDSHICHAKGSLEGALEILENGARFLSDPMTGQKTGWFFDLREPRGLLARLASGGSMLDLYCHTGAFGVQAARAGATEVLAIDRSGAALALAERSAALNGVADRCRFRQGEAFAELQSLNDAGRRFRTVVLDPPNFVKSRRELRSGLKGYRKLARLAAPLVEARGYLFIASCSHHVAVPDFTFEVARGLSAAGRSGRIVYAGGAGPDHPLHPHLPETGYIKWLALQLD